MLSLLGAMILIAAPMEQRHALQIAEIRLANPNKARRKEPGPPKGPQVSAPAALAEAPRKGADLASCASCHAPLTAGRKVHSPLKAGECSACHLANPGGVGKCALGTASAFGRRTAAVPRD